MLIVGLMETINLAHGSFFALGAYVALMIVAPPLPPDTAAAWLALPLAVRYGIALVLAPQSSVCSAWCWSLRCAEPTARIRCMHCY